MTNYARIESRSAYLSSEFGESYARRLFGDAVIDSLSRYVRGKRKGLLKGKLRWKKCTKGGWVKTGPYSDYGADGHVQARGFVSAEIDDGDWNNPQVIHSI